MAAGKSVNKNSTRGKGVVPVTGGKAPHLSADVSLITPLNLGKHAYIFAAEDGRNLHLRTDSAEFDAAVASIVAAGMGPRVHTELDSLVVRFPDHGWDKVVARLTANGVL